MSEVVLSQRWSDYVCNLAHSWGQRLNTRAGHGDDDPQMATFLTACVDLESLTPHLTRREDRMSGDCLRLICTYSRLFRAGDPNSESGPRVNTAVRLLRSFWSGPQISGSYLPPVGGRWWRLRACTYWLAAGASTEVLFSTWYYKWSSVGDPNGVRTSSRFYCAENSYCVVSYPCNIIVDKEQNEIAKLL